MCDIIDEEEILVFCSDINQEIKEDRGFFCVSCGIDIVALCLTR